jgi:tripartite-type tricarboxylate transporter receptor subunit TctC
MEWIVTHANSNFNNGGTKRMEKACSNNRDLEAMKLPHRRQFLHLAAGVAALPALPLIARAQAYPTRSVRIIVGFPPGGVADILARLIGQQLSERLGQPFIIENRPGASGNIGTEVVVRSAPDGYTFLLTGANDAISASLYEKLNFNFIRDVAPVASLVKVPLVMEVNPSVPAKSVLEFVSYAKANPGKISMASAGNGTSTSRTAALRPQSLILWADGCR